MSRSRCYPRQFQAKNGANVEGVADREDRNLVGVMSFALLGDWCTGRISMLAIKIDQYGFSE